MAQGTQTEVTAHELMIMLIELVFRYALRLSLALYSKGWYWCPLGTRSSSLTPSSSISLRNLLGLLLKIQGISKHKQLCLCAFCKVLSQHWNPW